MTTTQIRTPAGLAHPLDRIARPQRHGGTLLLVEDSRQASDAIRLMFQGAHGRMRRADSLTGARRHLALYTPEAVLIDLGLPDGSGLTLIADLARRYPGTMRILAMSGHPDLEAEARRAGAVGFIAKPFESAAQFRALLAPDFFAPRADSRPPDVTVSHGVALRDDLLLALDLLCGCAQQDRRGYALQFAATLARATGDVALAEAVHGARMSGCVTELITYLRRQIAGQPLI